MSSTFVDPEGGTLLCMDLDVITPLANHDNCLGSDLVILQFRQIDNHFAKEDQGGAAFQGGYDEQEDFPDEDALPGDQELDYRDKHTSTILSPSEHTKEDMEPFLVEQQPIDSNADILDTPDHLLVIYAMVSWLHLQFNLLCVACNAVLTILVYLVLFLNPQLVPPFITLLSIMHIVKASMGLDSMTCTKGKLVASTLKR